ncbi:hypothetical protein PRIPAC_93398 [Pristionchus pacificus]|uniref:Uncharacterized protein n=1 Tax=Pristionchus pacificus TaxID=54126 RepID=A0A2A6CQW0_PRIPA|nr:hypothetical protein PRIPAC_93398 [Pristionchus pacificus]|eukprot:PDM80510.1 hypothetical protein PRIPAC_35502 [Pristionchus pacificus]
MKVVFIPILLLPFLSAFGLIGNIIQGISGSTSELTIRGQLFCNGKPIGGKIRLIEKDLIMKDELDEVDIIVRKEDKRLFDPSLNEVCGPISQFYLHAEEKESDGAEWIMKIQPKCDDNPLCENEFVVDWSKKSIRGKQTFDMKKIDVCDEEHIRKSSEDPHSYVSFASGIEDDWGKDRKKRNDRRDKN